MSGKETRWHFGHPDGLAWASWDGEYVVFHKPSGMTHFLNESSARLIQDVLAIPRSVKEVADLLTIDGAEFEDDEWLKEVQGMLEHLEELGLIARTA